MELMYGSVTSHNVTRAVIPTATPYAETSAHETNKKKSDCFFLLSNFWTRAVRTLGQRRETEKTEAPSTCGIPELQCSLCSLARGGGPDGRGGVGRGRRQSGRDWGFLTCLRVAPRQEAPLPGALSPESTLCPTSEGRTFFVLPVCLPRGSSLARACQR